MFRIVASRRVDEWLAWAERTDTNERFGLECAGPTEETARRRVIDWLDWQQQHSVALEALQQAERSYHRTIAASAFAGPVEGGGSIEMQQESLDALEAARERLDAVRSRRPISSH